MLQSVKLESQESEDCTVPDVGCNIVVKEEEGNYCGVYSQLAHNLPVDVPDSAPFIESDIEPLASCPVQPLHYGSLSGFAQGGLSLGGGYDVVGAQQLCGDLQPSSGQSGQLVPELEHSSGLSSGPSSEDEASPASWAQPSSFVVPPVTVNSAVRRRRYVSPSRSILGSHRASPYRLRPWINLRPVLPVDNTSAGVISRNLREAEVFRNEVMPRLDAIRDALFCRCHGGPVSYSDLLSYLCERFEAA
jgi:hypothetical protein